MVNNFGKNLLRARYMCRYMRRLCSALVPFAAAPAF